MKFGQKLPPVQAFFSLSQRFPHLSKWGGGGQLLGTGHGDHEDDLGNGHDEDEDNDNEDDQNDNEDDQNYNDDDENENQYDENDNEDDENENEYDVNNKEDDDRWWSPDISSSHKFFQLDISGAWWYYDIEEMPFGLPAKSRKAPPLPPPYYCR